MHFGFPTQTHSPKLIATIQVTPKTQISSEMSQGDGNLNIDVRCVVCWDEYDLEDRKPVRMPCTLHCVCMSCRDNMAEDAQSEEKEVHLRCPFCRNEDSEPVAWMTLAVDMDVMERVLRKRTAGLLRGRRVRELDVDEEQPAKRARAEVIDLCGQDVVRDLSAEFDGAA